VPPAEAAPLELAAGGSLRIPAALAALHFPHDVLVVLPRGRELWLLPTRGAAAGGLILKQRNRAGDRSVLIWEALPSSFSPGPLDSFWDAENGALRVALPWIDPAAQDIEARTQSGHAPAGEPR
jgi:hypothetical protein